MCTSTSVINQITWFVTRKKLNTDRTSKTRCRYNVFSASYVWELKAGSHSYRFCSTSLIWGKYSKV